MYAQIQCLNASHGYISTNLVTTAFCFIINHLRDSTAKERPAAGLNSLCYSFIMGMTYASVGAALAFASVAATQSLEDICTIDYVQASLPAANYILGIVPNADSVVASPVMNASVTASEGQIGGSGYDFCNVTFSYTHTGLDDTVRTSSA